MLYVVRLKPSALLLTLLTLIIALTGCGSTAGSPPDPTSLPSTVPPVTPTLTSTEASIDELAANTVIVADTSGSSVTLMSVSLDDGFQKVVATFPSSRGISLVGGSIQRQMFDATYTRMALAWEDEDSEARHVGWMTAQGERIDITEAISGPGGFSRGPRHSNPRFDPFTDQFFYVDETSAQAIWVDINTLEVTDRIPLDRWVEGSVFFIGATGEVETWGNRYPKSIMAPGGGAGQISSNRDEFIGWLPPDMMIYVDGSNDRIATTPVDCRREDCHTYITPETDYSLTGGVSKLMPS